MTKGAREAQLGIAIAGGRTPLQRHSEIVVFKRDTPYPRQLIAPVQPRKRAFCPANRPSDVTGSGVLHFACGRMPLGGVLSDRFMQPISRLVGVRGSRDLSQGFINKSRQKLE